MSFTTNPIANRLNLNKGWNFSTFPETVSFYSNDTVFLFKLFLFLKAYFNLSKIKLVTCELRCTEAQIHILYLVLNISSKRKKKKNYIIKPIRSVNSGLFKSIFTNPNYHQAAQLLFLDLPFLKKALTASILPVFKQSPTRCWLTTFRQKSWLNYLQFVFNFRNKYIKNTQNLILKTNKKNLSTLPFSGFHLRTILAIKQKLMHEFFLWLFYLKILKKKKNLTLDFFILYKKKLFYFTKLFRRISNLTRLLLNTSKKKFIFNRNKLSPLIPLLKKINNKKKKKLITRIVINQYNSYSILQKKPNYYQITNKLLRLLKKKKSRFKKRILWTNTLKSSLLNSLWTNFLFQTKILTYKKNLFYKKWQTVYKFHNKKIKKKTKKLSFLKFKKLKLKIQNQKIKTFLRFYWNSQKNNFNLFLFSLRRYRKFKKISFLLALYKHSRFIQKTKEKTSLIHQGLKWKLNQNIQKSILIKKKVSHWTYRQNFRKKYQKHLKLSLRYKFTFHLKKFIQSFFKINLQLKCIQPIVEHKNLNFFRLIYIKHSKKKKKFFKNLRESKIKNYHKIFKKKINKNTYLVTRSFSNDLVEQDLQKNLKKNKKTIYRKLRKLRFVKKPEFYQRLRQTTTRLYAPSKFQNVRNKLLLSYFIPTVMLFVKYLNPQLLAEHIAKEFEKTKRHRTVLFALKDGLRSLRFSRAKGYKICIRGRINSAQKTKTFYFSRNSFSLQTFDQNVKFGFAQANARIGAFGINVWLYY